MLLGSPRPISNKTRIETNELWRCRFVKVFSQTDFQQNKDWNCSPDGLINETGLTPRPISNKTRIETQSNNILAAVQRDSQTDFQQNKDWN